MNHHPVEIFIAYSRMDTPFLENFRKQFSPLERRGRVKIWYDGEIVAGEIWESAIKAAIHKADIIMLLVSADSLASDYFYEQEVSNALARHKAGEAKVVPVILRACPWRSTELADLQALPKDGKPLNSWTDTDEAYANVVEGILKIVEDHERAIQKKEVDSIKEEEAKRKQQKAEEEKAARAQQVALAKSNKEKTKKEATQNKIEQPNASTSSNTNNTSPEFKIDTQLVLLLSVILVIIFGLFKATMWLLSDNLPSNNSNPQLNNNLTEKFKNTTYIETGISPSFKMIAIPAGTFTMGCTNDQQDCYDDEKPTHQVTLSDFYIGETEVTQAQWYAVMDTKPSNFWGCNDCPVEQVSWDDVQIFLSKLNTKCNRQYRLPTEAEWEYAARGAQSYKYAGSNNIDDVAWCPDNSGSKIHSVKGKRANSYGLYDMSGNVYEWCSDWYGNYNSNSQTNPKGVSLGSRRVIRGGSWNGYSQGCRVAIRGSYTPDKRVSDMGFRLVSSQ